MCACISMLAIAVFQQRPKKSGSTEMATHKTQKQSVTVALIDADTHSNGFQIELVATRTPLSALFHPTNQHYL